MSEKFNYIIYHDNCFDGFTGFFLFMKTDRWESKPFIYPDNPHARHAPPGIDGKNVIVIDVAYKPVIVEEIAKRARKLLFIDHHVTLINDIEKLNLKSPNEIFYNKDHSGASLVWEYFYPGKPMPEFVKYIEDNDIGAWKYRETLPFMAGLEVNFELVPTHQNLKKWDKLLNEKYLHHLIKDGEKYLVYKDYLIDKSSTKFAVAEFPGKKVYDKYKHFFKSAAQFRVAVVNGACPSVSLVGKKIAEDNKETVDFVALYNYILEKKKYVVSLRSVKADVGSIAKIFGGGGHEFASAFSFSKEVFDIDDVFVIKVDKDKHQNSSDCAY